MICKNCAKCLSMHVYKTESTMLFSIDYYKTDCLAFGEVNSPSYCQLYESKRKMQRRLKKIETLDSKAEKLETKAQQLRLKGLRLYNECDKMEVKNESN